MSLIEEALKKQRALATTGLQAVQRQADLGPAAATPAAQNQEQVVELYKRPSRSLPPCELDREAMASRGYCLVSDEMPGLNGQFRSLKHHLTELLVEARLAGRAPLVSITSANPGDGKSFVSLNLAFALSLERELQVTLVDYDPYRRRTSELFGVADSVGLLDVVAGDVEGGIAAVERDTNRAQLSLIPAGRESPNMSELLTSPGFDNALDAMRRSSPRRLFLFDCAPVLATPISSYLARRSDLTLVVVRSEVTSCHAVQDALAKLGPESRSHLVLNGYTGSITERYYGYSKELRDYAS